MNTLGVVGHVDHGKSTLVRALTGVDPHHLPEEKRRGMTIDPGFVSFMLPNGRRLGIIDVPGHRDFVQNMLAGVAGIRGALIIIAADEGIMPQTHEHVEILTLLGIEHAVIVLTKTDAVPEPDWLDLVETEVRDFFAPTPFSASPVVRVSAYAGLGMDGLHRALQSLDDTLPPDTIGSQMRLPIDRVFSLPGIGTIVTGTLRGSPLHAGEEVEVYPRGFQSRIRGMQSFGEPVEIALPGTRVALNLTGITKHELARGDTIARSGVWSPTTMLDVHVSLLPSAGSPLTHNAELKVFLGTGETMGRARVLGSESIRPGESGWIQLELRSHVFALRGDRLVLRRPSPAATIGGGLVIDAHPNKRYRRFQPGITERLRTRMQSSPTEMIVMASNGPEPIQKSALQAQTNLADDAFNSALSAALTQGRVIELLPDRFLSHARLQAHLAALEGELYRYHSQFPLRIGPEREWVRSRLNLNQAAFQALLRCATGVIVTASTIRLASHSIQFDAEQQNRVDQLMRAFADSPFAPPTYPESCAIAGQEEVNALIEIGDLVAASQEILFKRTSYETAVAQVLSLIDAQGSVSVAQIRDTLGTSRKYVLPLLEHLDALGITWRTGDVRVRRLPAAKA